jgi:O-antigen ligase
LGLPGLNVFNILFLGIFYQYLKRETKTNEKTPLSGALKFYYFTAIIAFLFSLSVSNHIFANATILKNIIVYSSLYFLIYGIVDNEDDLKYYIKVVYFVVFLMIAEIIKEKLSFGIGSSKRVAGAFGQDASAANYAGVFLAIFLPLLLKNFLYKSKNFVNPVIGLGIFLMGVFAIFYTYSRQAYGSLAVTSVLNFAKKNKILLTIVLLLLFNSQVWLPESVVERIQGTQVESDTGEEKLDESTESRLVIWEQAYNNLIVHNWMGVGLNEFQDRIDPYLPEWIHARDAHNSFVLIMTESGILGLVAFLYLLLKMYSTGRMIRLNAEKEHVKMLGEGYQLIIIAVIMGNIYSSTFYSPEVMGNFWILSALIHKYYAITSNENISKKEDEVNNGQA